MAMESSSTTSFHSVVSEFEGTLLKHQDPFPYFMLVAFEVSGLIRFTILLFLWPVTALLDVFGYKNAALKLMIFVATAGVRESEIELVARAVLPKFYMDDVSMDTWRVFQPCKKRVVVTRMPRVMVESFAKEHLGADEVIGTELIVNWFGFFTGETDDTDQSVFNRVGNLFVDRRPHLGLGRPAKMISTTFLSLCEEQMHTPVHWNHRDQQTELEPPKPVIFHDGRLVKRPTPAKALLTLLWMPLGIILAAIRVVLIFVLPLRAMPYVIGILRIQVTVKGKPPRSGSSGLLYVGNHKTFLDPFVLYCALGRSIPCIALWPLSVKSWLIWDKSCVSSWLENLSPITPVWVLRSRDNDAKQIKEALSKGDVVIFPEGAWFNEPFLLRFSALFAELSDGIVPVAMNGGTGLTVGSSAGFFRATTRGWGRRWSCRNAVLILMNPTLVYEVTFLDQLPLEETCSSGKSPYDVANHVQRILGDALGFECTNFTRKDKYKFLT